MKRRIILLFFIITIQNIYSQDESIEKLMTRNYFDCRDITYNSQTLIPYYYYSGKTDSARIINDYWIRKCGYYTDNSIAELLLAIKEKKFNNDSISFHTFYDMMNYKMLYVPFGSHERYPGFSFARGSEAVEDSFFMFIHDIALSINLMNPDNISEQLLTEFFSGNIDSAFIKMQEPSARNSGVQKLYNEGIERIFSFGTYYYGIFAGSWFPAGKEIQGFGPLPIAGLTIGICNANWDVGLSLQWRFGKTKEKYKILYEDKTYITNKQLGISANIEAAKNLLLKKHSDFSLIGGMFFEGYNPPKSEADLGDKGINSIGLIIGASYGYMPWSLGNIKFNIQVRYHQYLFNTSKPEAPMGSSFTVVLNTVFNAYSDIRDYLEFMKYQWDEL